MLDEMKLFEHVNRMIGAKNGVMNESYTPFAGHETVQLFVRSKYGGGGRGGNTSIHDCTVKIIIVGRNENIELPVPVYPYTNIPSAKIEKKYNDAIKAMNRILGQQMANSILSFVYDNQMWLRALWEAKDVERGKIGSIPYNYLQDEISSSKYMGLSLTPKTEKELDEDKKEITKYVRKQLKDDSIQIDFGSVRADDSKHKKKR